MYYFVYQCPKHRRTLMDKRINKASVRGEFSLKDLRQYIGEDNYVIHGRGEFWAQKMLWPVIGKAYGRQDFMEGHVIEIKDPKYATWLKMNHQIIGQRGAALVETYVALDRKTIEDYCDKINELGMFYETLRRVSYEVRQVSSRVTSIDAICASDRFVWPEKLLDWTKRVKESSFGGEEAFYLERERVKEEFGALKDGLLRYVLSKKTGNG